MAGIALFVLFAAVLLVVVYGLWRYWSSLVARSPDEEHFEARIAALNERQANRYSDEELTAPPSEEDAWEIMVRRGRRTRRAIPRRRD